MQFQISFRPYILRTTLLFVIGWGGLGALLYYFEPTILPRWAFFACVTLALTSTAFPIIYFIETRFSQSHTEVQVMVRQALWMGIFGATLAWLQLARLVTLYVVLGLAGGLAAIESLLRLREQARWRVPDVEDDDQPA